MLYESKIFLVSTVLVVGCSRNEQVVTPDRVSWVASSDEDGMDGVEAAVQLSNLNEKDSALATACRKAARGGVGQAVLKGIPLIYRKELRDEVACDCAVNLGWRSDTHEIARTVAELISDEKLRKEVVEQIDEAAQQVELP